MKKLTERYKKWLVSRGHYEFKKRIKRQNLVYKNPTIDTSHTVTAWFGSDSEEIIAENNPIIPPQNLSIRGNPLATLSFLESVRDSLNIRKAYANPNKYSWLKRAKSKRGKKRLSKYFDFSSINSVSTAVALVLTAEYHRVSQIIGSVPPAINLDKWSDGVFWPMYRIGFFEAIGQIKEADALTRNLDGVDFLRAITGKTGNDLRLVADELRMVGERLVEQELQRSFRIDLNNAVGEAMINVSKWAYPSDHVFTVPHLGNFWVTASADHATGMFTVVIYDQGVSIPISYPKKKLSSRARSFLIHLVSGEDKFAYADDGAYIACAMEFGSSSSGVGYRGKGLPQMKALIDKMGNGSLMICSRGGLWQYECGSKPKYQSFPHSIGGTLVEWRINLSNQSEAIV